MTTPAHPFNDNEQPFENEENSDEAVAPAEDEAQQLKQRIAALEEEAAKLRDQWVRAVAETENVRKRAQKTQEDTVKYAVTDFAGDMVSVLENLMRANATIPAEARAANPLLKTLGEGIDMTLGEMLSIFERYGIRRIDPQAQKFDPNFHQAVAQVETAEVPPGAVAQVVQAGYTIHDRLLRPAMVAVAKAADPAKKVDTTA